jgi:hypothetical protein
LCLSVNGNDSDFIILEQIEGPGARRIGAFLLDAIVNDKVIEYDILHVLTGLN